MTLDSYLQELNELESSLNKIVDKIIKEKSTTLVGLVRNRLYQRGVDAFGKEITPTYAKSTIESKKEKNQRSSFVTLRNTGAFYGGIFVKSEDFVITVGSTDSKTDYLISKYGEGILGFTKNEQDFIALSIIEPEIQKALKKINNTTIQL